MQKILNTKYTKPIEREYEAWIIQEIEKYFQSLGIKFIILAVSPIVESIWPADDYLSYYGLTVGLQFKKVELAQGKIDFTRLFWSLSRPKNQFDLILRTPNIFYCLPTFINRDFRSQALHHCLFWKPEQDTISRYAWYDNPNKQLLKTIFSEIKKAPRWGLFVEQILYSPLYSERIFKRQQLEEFYFDLININLARTDDVEREECTDGTYLLYVEV